MTREPATQVTSFADARGAGACPRLPAHPRIGLAIALTTLASSFGLRPSAVEAGEAISRADREGATRVPRWDARGVGAMPRQGIACLDVSGDARFLAVGTVAPPGDPNVVLLDGDGRVVRSHAVGQRWVEQVTVDRSGRVVHALCTMPGGLRRRLLHRLSLRGRGRGRGRSARAGRLRAQPVPLRRPFQPPRRVAEGLGLGRGRRDGRPGLPAGRGRRAVAPLGRLSAAPDAVTTALAVGPGGQVVVGCTGRLDGEGRRGPQPVPPGRGRPPAGLVPTGRRRRGRPSRAGAGAVRDADPAGRDSRGPPAARRPGLGPALRRALRAGRSCAASRPPIIPAGSAGSGRRPRGATRTTARGSSPRPPRSPSTTPEAASSAGSARTCSRRAVWFDLKFLPGGKRLIAYPHRWTSRGLAGQPTLPADEDARTVYVLDVETGGVRAIEFPDAVSDLDVGDAGGVAACCWDGRVYLARAGLAEPVQPGAASTSAGPAWSALSRDGATSIVATAARRRSSASTADGKELWQTDLNKALPARREAVGRNARAKPIGEGRLAAPRRPRRERPRRAAARRGAGRPAS